MTTKYRNLYTLIRECEKSPHYADNLKATLEASRDERQWCLWPLYIAPLGFSH